MHNFYALCTRAPILAASSADESQKYFFRSQIPRLLAADHRRGGPWLRLSHAH